MSPRFQAETISAGLSVTVQTVNSSSDNETLFWAEGRAYAARPDGPDIKIYERPVVEQGVVQPIPIAVSPFAGDPDSMVIGVDEGGYMLGLVLFDTDKSAIRPEFGPLLDRVAQKIEQRGEGVVTLVGHTDVRGSHAHNTALGLRRAYAVFDALAKRLSPEVRAKLFQQGWQVKGTTAEGLANRIQTDTRALGAVITSQGFKAE